MDTQNLAKAGQMKRDLRRTVKELAAGLDPEYCVQADRAIFMAVTRLEAYVKARTVFCFVGTKDEIDTAPIINHALESGKRVAVPRCIAKGRMDAFLIDSLDRLQAGKYGIPEPGEEAIRINPEEIDLAVMPCLTCSRTGKRLGYGGGYYDRYLEKMSGVKAAICRERVMRENIPMEDHDQMVDLVITEKGAYESHTP